MKTAEEWAASDSHFEVDCKDCLRLIRAIQTDALEAAALIARHANGPGEAEIDIDALKPVRP